MAEGQEKMVIKPLLDYHFPVACQKDEFCYQYGGQFDALCLKGDTRGHFFSFFFVMFVLQLVLCSSQQFSFLTFPCPPYFLTNFPSLIHFSYLIPHFLSPYPQDEIKVSFFFFQHLPSCLAWKHSWTARFPFEVEH